MQQNKGNKKKTSIDPVFHENVARELEIIGGGSEIGGKYL